MFAIIRALTYASLFVSFILIYLPARLLKGSGMVYPEEIGIVQVLAIIITTLGGLLALWCVLTFAVIGKGTPAPFDPPRRLVVRGPYRFVRNPMYLGAGIALSGASIFYASLPLLGYTGFFFLCTHLFAVLYEEPTLNRLFGKSYEKYCRQINRWWPAFPRE